ncbi:hypothetical protein MC885_013538, partial [Smutsia gigantea]
MVVQAEDLHREEDGPTKDLHPEGGELSAGHEADARSEPQGTGAFHEETEDSYPVEENASQAYNQDVEEMVYEQESPDSIEPVVDDDERMYHVADDVTYQDYNEQ